MNTVASLSRYIKEQLSETVESEELQQFVLLIFDHLRGYNRVDLMMKGKEILSEDEVYIINEAVARLLKHEPLQYVLGQTEFMGSIIMVNGKVLIPRPETEELVSWILDEHLNDNISVLDIGTGSGCIPIAIKQRRPRALVEAWDISGEALEVAIGNAELNGVEVDFHHRDVLNFRKYELATKDIVVSNPPYVTAKEKKVMKANVLDFEPHQALFVEDDEPLVFYKAIAELAMVVLRPGGYLYFEINEAYGDELHAMLEGFGFKSVVRRKDLSGRWRMVRAIRPVHP
jgi:release factor glutamine methyltransferase